MQQVRNIILQQEYQTSKPVHIRVQGEPKNSVKKNQISRSAHPQMSHLCHVTACSPGDVAVRPTHPRVLPDGHSAGDVPTKRLAAGQVHSVHECDRLPDGRRAAGQRGRVR